MSYLAAITKGTATAREVSKAMDHLYSNNIDNSPFNSLFPKLIQYLTAMELVVEQEDYCFNHSSETGCPPSFI